MAKWRPKVGEWVFIPQGGLIYLPPGWTLLPRGRVLAHSARRWNPIDVEVCLKSHDGVRAYRTLPCNATDIQPADVRIVLMWEEAT